MQKGELNGNLVAISTHYLGPSAWSTHTVTDDTTREQDAVVPSDAHVGLVCHPGLRRPPLPHGVQTTSRTEMFTQGYC